MKVPFFEWANLFLEDRENYLDLIDKTLSKGSFILQQEVADFEAKIRSYLDIEHAIGVSDGTNAILLGLRASGVGTGDEILLPSHAFIAAAQSIHFSGARPVIVDIDPDDWLLSADSIEANITERTTAIMPVHVNGRLCNMERICEVAERYGLRVFEDAAQALGARFDGAPAGYFGEWATFSFYPSKTLGSFGDAGGLVTRNDEIAKKMMSMRNHGADENKMIPTNIDVWGTNCRLDNLHAAILSYKMDRYDRHISRRRQSPSSIMTLSRISLQWLFPRPLTRERAISMCSRIMKFEPTIVTSCASISQTMGSGRSFSGAGLRSTI